MIFPVLLCGGTGTRLWPLSRESYPKQFVKIIGEDSLFQQAARRMSGKHFMPPTVITNTEFRFIVTEQLVQTGIDPGSILIEPSQRNTAPGILATALHIYKNNPDGIILAAPADHLIPDIQEFKKTILRGMENASNDQIITFGIKITRPETGYGYLKLAERPSLKPTQLLHFVEKPSLNEAKNMHRAKNFLWNSGIFLFKAKTIIAEFKKYKPQLYELVLEATENSTIDLGFIRLDANSWNTVENISVDYAIMEKSKNLSVVPFYGSWTDLGEWNSVWKESGPNKNGVATSGPVKSFDCKDSLIRSDDPNLYLLGLGLNNIAVIGTRDAVLIADKSRLQDVKEAVSIMKKENVLQSTKSLRDRRPWGWFELLITAEKFQVKQITVYPGASLSLQSHQYRAEHWVVVSGSATVTINKKQQLVHENQSIYIPLKEKHRLSNNQSENLVLIEVQTGTYFGEDDIIRHDDLYERR